MVSKYKKQSNSLLESAKDTTKLGLTSMVGMGALSSMSKVTPGSADIAKTAGIGLNLVNVGNVANIGLNMSKGFK